MITIEITGDCSSELEKLAVHLSLLETEVIRNALSLYAYTVGHKILNSNIKFGIFLNKEIIAEFYIPGIKLDKVP